MSITLNSCITYLNKELDMKPKLVLHCFVTPQLDTTILILTNSAPLFTTNPRKIEAVANATVEISDNNYSWVKMEFDTLFKVYFIPQVKFPIHEGKTYYIRASAPGFETISSSCTVPYLRETNFNFVVGEICTRSHEPGWYYGPHRHNHFEWTDYAGEENYYVFQNKTLHAIYGFDIYGEFTDTIYKYSYSFCYNEAHKPCISSDHGQDGKKMYEMLSPYYLYHSTIDTLNITMLQTDKHWHMYHMSLLDYNGDFQFFLLEPTPLYTNIKNGYGVFGAFVMREYVFEVDME